MANVYGTDGRLLEQLALNEELSVSELARATGLSYPTAFYKVKSFPFVSFQKTGRESKVQIRDEDIDAIYPFLITIQTNMTKRAQLVLAFLYRKGMHDAVLGGEVALESQLPVKDADPDPEIEIRTKNPKKFIEFANRTLTKSIGSELTSNSKIVEDADTTPVRKMGLLQLSRPEKLLVDAIAEKQSRIFVENVAESMTNSHYGVDMDLLTSYADSRGVLDETIREIDAAKGSGFP